MATVTIQRTGTETISAGGPWNFKTKDISFYQSDVFEVQTTQNSINQTIYSIENQGYTFCLAYLYKNGYISELDLKQINAESILHLRVDSYNLRRHDKCNEKMKDVVLKIYSQGGYLLISAAEKGVLIDGKIHVFSKIELPNKITLQLPYNGGRTIPRFVEFPLAKIENIL